MRSSNYNNDPMEIKANNKQDFESIVNKFIGNPNEKEENKEIQKVADYFKYAIKH